MTLREATGTDREALVGLQDATMGVDTWTPTQVAEELERPGGITWVAEDQTGGLIGFGFGWVVFDELQILQVAVSPAARGRGVGRAILAALEDHAPGADVAFLEVRVDNEPAIRLYVAAGYRIIGRRARYYADGTDALVMRKGLRPTSG